MKMFKLNNLNIFTLFKSAIKINNRLTYKSTTIVIPNSLGVTKRLKQWIGFQDNILNSLYTIPAAADPRYIGHYVLSSYRLAGA